MVGTWLIALSVRDRRCVLFGGDDDTRVRAERLLDEGASVTIVWPTLAPSLISLAKERENVTLVERAPDVERDTNGALVVLVVPVARELSRALYARAATGSFLLCAVDDPEHCTFTQVATVKRGPLRVGVSSSGTAPMLARRIREALDRALDGRFTRFVEALAEKRARWPSGQRAQEASKALEGFEVSVSLRLPDWARGEQ